MSERVDKVSNIISCNWVGLVLSPYCTLMPWAQGPGLMETQMRTSIKDLQRCHGLRLVTVGHPVALSPGSVVTSMACCSSYCKPKTKLFFSVGSELPLLWEESSVITKSESIFNGNFSRTCRPHAGPGVESLICRTSAGIRGLVTRS